MNNEQKAVSLTYFNVWQRHTNNEQKAVSLTYFNVWQRHTNGEWRMQNYYPAISASR